MAHWSVEKGLVIIKCPLFVSARMFSCQSRMSINSDRQKAKQIQNSDGGEFTFWPISINESTNEWKRRLTIWAIDASSRAKVDNLEPSHLCEYPFQFLTLCQFWMVVTGGRYVRYLWELTTKVRENLQFCIKVYYVRRKIELWDTHQSHSMRNRPPQTLVWLYSFQVGGLSNFEPVMIHQHTITPNFSKADQF
jgi:hypothetical protein